MTEKDGEDEADRRILGAAMVHEYYWGAECCDGRIRLHDEYCLILPEEERPSLWDFFEKEAFSYKWGSVPFRYIDNHKMQEVLYNLCVSEGEKNQECSVKFYDYFCEMNRIKVKKPHE